MFKLGATSLSVIVIFCEVVVLSANPDEGSLIVKTAVSEPSTKMSSATVKVTEPEVCPFTIVITELLKE